MKPYTLSQVQDLVEDAIRRSSKRHTRWRQLEELYRTGDVARATALGTTGSDGDGTLFGTEINLAAEHVNITQPNIDIILASTLRHDPRVLAVPVAGGPGAEQAKHLAENVVQHYWRTEDVTATLKDATWDAVVTGNGFLKVGWINEEEEREPDDDERAELLEQAIDVEFGQALLEERDPKPVEDLEQMLPGEVTEILEDKPFVSYVSPYDIFVPPNARRIGETRWIAQRVTLPLADLADNPELEGEVTSDTGMAGGRLSGDDEVAEWRRKAEAEHGLHQDPELFETATLYEFYDMAARKMVVFQLGASEPLYEGDIPYSHSHPPFVHIRNRSTSGVEFWGMGDVENVANIQHLFNEFLTEQIDNARRSGNKYLVEEGSWSEDLAAVLETDVPDAVAKINANGMPLSEVIHAVERKALSGDVYGAKVDLENYMRSVLGINDFQAGGVGADRMSATAAAVVDGVASLRAEEKVWQVEQAAAKTGLLMLLLCQEHLDTDVAVRIAGEAGAEWVTLSKEDLQGEYILQIEGGSMQAVNPATREQKAMRLVNEIAPQIAELGFDPVPAFRAALRDMGYDPDVLLVEQPEPDAPEQPAGPGSDALPAPPTGPPPPSAMPMPGDEGALPADVPAEQPLAGLEAQLGADIAL